MKKLRLTNLKIKTNDDAQEIASPKFKYKGGTPTNYQLVSPHNHLLYPLTSTNQTRKTLNAFNKKSANTSVNENRTYNKNNLKPNDKKNNALNDLKGNHNSSYESINPSTRKLNQTVLSPTSDVERTMMSKMQLNLNLNKTRVINNTKLKRNVSELLDGNENKDQNFPNIEQFKINKTLTPKVSKPIELNYPKVSTNNSNSTTQTNSMSNSPRINPGNPEVISVTSLMNNQNIPISLANLSAYFPQYETTKSSSKPIGNIRAYAANTYQGIIRNYNEDRVSIILNIVKPPNFKGAWPKCSFFGIYDGHGGSTCADFLRDNLHTYIVKDSYFPANPKEALIRGFENAEQEFINNYALTQDKSSIIDKSGSCAVIALIVDDICYIANVGDSRAVLSVNKGKYIKTLTNDHKPNEENENKRIIQNGGNVYQTQTSTRLFNISDGNHSHQILLGPYRVYPGRLSVSRTFGDIEAKVNKFGGIPGVIVATPEISSFSINNDVDFLVLGCDGIFDQLTNQDVSDCIWMTVRGESRAKLLHHQCALGVDLIMKSSLVRKTLDNVTVLLICFQNFENYFNEKNPNTKENLSPQSSFYLYNVIENKESENTNFYQSNEENSVQIENPAVRKKSTPKISRNVVEGVTGGVTYNGKMGKIVGLDITKKIITSPRNKVKPELHNVNRTIKNFIKKSEY